MAKSKVETPKAQASISQFANESEVITIDGFTIENRLDRVQIYGEVGITRDKAGLENIPTIKRRIDTIADYLKHADLPEKIEVLEAMVVKNPLVVAKPCA